MEERNNPWTVLETKEVYDTPWIKVIRHEVLNPNNNPGVYSVVQFKNLAIGILPLDEDYNTWIVGQWRFPTNCYSWEIPEGGGDPNLPPVESAKRELSEEVGIAANSWELIHEFHTSNSAADEVSYIFVARDLTFHEPHPEDDEQLEIRKLPFNELYQMVMDGVVKDSLTIITVLKAKILIDEGKL